MTGERLAVGVDVGGTKVNALLVDADGAVRAREVRPTPADDVAATLEALVGAALAVRTDDAVVVGVGAAGLVERDTGRLLFAPNLAWREVDLVSLVGAASGLPVRVDNDCTVAAYGEWRVGAARGVRDMLYVGVGTGIGGGLVLDGRLYHGAHGFAGEIGHIVVQPDGVVCGCGNRGCWETVASGQAIERDGRAAVGRHAHSAIAERSGGVVEAVTGTMVSEAAADGDPTARGILAEVGMRLGEGIAGLVNVLDPSLVVVGGGVAVAGEHLLGPARHAYAATVEARDARPDVPIVPAALGPDGAAVGAALLALAPEDP
jgi:glucokinase